MDLRAATLCGAETGHVYVIGRCSKQEHARVMEGVTISSIGQGAGGPDTPLAHSRRPGEPHQQRRHLRHLSGAQLLSQHQETDVWYLAVHMPNTLLFIC